MLSREEIEAGLRALPAPPTDVGVVRLVVCRLAGEGRETPEAIHLVPGNGVVGDRWGLKRRQTCDSEVTVMRHDVASLLREGESPAILGDNLFVDIDTSRAALPPGTVVRVGTARCVVTPEPHTGCRKFAARVGADALAITRDPAWEAHQLRGIHLQILEEGVVRPGDRFEVVQRPG